LLDQGRLDELSRVLDRVLEWIATDAATTTSMGVGHVNG
jgi:hypothetical protein